MNSVLSDKGVIRLLICDDHHLLTECLATVVESWSPGILVADPVATADEAVAISEQEHPDVVLMDVHLEGPTNGIEATRRISVCSPSTHVIVMTGDRSDRWLYESVEAGASGLLQKDETIERLLEAVEQVANGDLLFEPARFAHLSHAAIRMRTERLELQRRLDLLTKRERQIIESLRDGWRNDQIAAALFISPRTVESHVQNISQKLGVHSKLETVAFLRRAEAAGALG